MAAIAAAADGNQTAGTTVTITHPGDTVDDPATMDDPATLETVENNEFVEGMRAITVTVCRYDRNRGRVQGNPGRHGPQRRWRYH